MTRKRLTDRGVAALKPRAKPYTVGDPELGGHWIRVQPSGGRSFYAVCRNPSGKQIWTRLLATSIKQARQQAREIIQRVRAGLPAFEPRAESVGAIVENWRRRHLEANAVRTAKEINRLLDAHVLPALA